MTRLATPALLLALGPLWSCTDYGYTQLSRKDTFQQVRRNTVDILLVVDDSCSMVEEQDKLADNFDGFLSAFEGADVDWRIGAITTDTADREAAGRLVGGGDELALRSPDGRLLDRVAWTREWPVASGVALQLDPGVTDPGEADARDAWCAAEVAFDDADLGSPGATNPACPAGGPPPPPPDTGFADGGSGDTGAGDSGAGDSGAGDTGSGDTGAPLRGPSVGEVLFTEIMVDPAARPDAEGEWVELRSLAAEDLDLGGHRIEDDTGHGATLPAGTTLAAGGTLVVGRSALDWVDVVVADGLRLADPVRVVTPAQPDAAELFAELVAVGIEGAGIEMGLEATRLALLDPDVSADNAFLRDDANLSLIFLSDEDDQSPAPVGEWLREIGALKGDAAFRTPGVLTVSAVAGVEAPAFEGGLSCESGDGAAEFGARFVALAEATDGAAESICDDDFSPIAYELGLTASGLGTTFVLSAPADPGSLTVSLYDADDEDSLVAVLDQGTDYRFDAAANAVVFDADQAPPSESWIVVEYVLLATGQEVVE